MRRSPPTSPPRASAGGNWNGFLAVEKLPAMVTEFDEALWGSLVDHLTVNDKDDIVFTMTSGMEIKA